MIAVYLNSEVSFYKESIYVFRLFFEIIGINFDFVDGVDSLKAGNHKIIITYGEPLNKRLLPKNSFQINIAQFDYSAFLKTNTEPTPKFLINKNTNQRSIPYLFSKSYLPLQEQLWEDEESGHVLISAKKNHISCDVDLICTAFYLLSLKNEEVISRRDVFNRFLRKFAKNSAPVYNFAVVDAYCELLYSFLKKAAHSQGIPLIKKALWPGRHRFALCLTHDIDRLNTWMFPKIKSYIVSLFRRRINPLNFIYQLFRLLFSVLHPESWRGNFDMILRVEEKYGFRSSFYFVAGKTHELDPVYNLNSSIMQNRFNFLKQHEVEIGLHGSFLSSENPGMLKSEKQALVDSVTQEPVGGRQHFLRFTNPETFQNIEEASLTYDATLGFSDAIGFRCGISFPYKPYNPATDAPYSFHEFPLHIMESAIQKRPNYRFLHQNNIEPVWKEIQVILRQIKNYNGCVNVLWHNSDFDRFDISWYTKLYENILNWVYINNGWGCSGRELVEWWQKRSEIRINLLPENEHEFYVKLENTALEEFTVIIEPPEQWSNCDIEYESCTGEHEVRDGKIYITLKNILSDEAKLKLSVEEITLHT